MMTLYTETSLVFNDTCNGISVHVVDEVDKSEYGNGGPLSTGHVIRRPLRRARRVGHFRAVQSGLLRTGQHEDGT